MRVFVFTRLSFGIAYYSIRPKVQLDAACGHLPQAFSRVTNGLREPFCTFIHRFVDSLTMRGAAKSKPRQTVDNELVVVSKWHDIL